MLEFNDTTHEYFVAGKKVPSVTQVLSFLAVDKAEKANPILRDQAARRGSRIHEATQMFDLTGDIPDELVDADTAPYISAYIQFCRDYAPTWEFIEMQITDGDVAGTIDRVGLIDGEQTVVDIKTGSTVDVRQVSAQTYAYSRLLKANGQHPLGCSIAVLQLRKNGSYSFRKLDSRRGRMFWNECKVLYDMIRKDKEMSKQREKE